VKDCGQRDYIEMCMLMVRSSDGRCMTTVRSNYCYSNRLLKISVFFLETKKSILVYFDLCILYVQFLFITARSERDKIGVLFLVLIFWCSC